MRNDDIEFLLSGYFSENKVINMLILAYEIFKLASNLLKD